MIVNWLLTRRCNRHCPFCGLVNDSKCNSYKKIQDVNDKELPWSRTIETILRMNEVYGKDKLFHIFYGGEPFLKEGFKEFMMTVNSLDVNYTVITNATLLYKVIEVFNAAGQYKGLTCSLDPIIMESGNPLNNIKNNAALELLETNKKRKLTKDMTVECVFDKNNVKYTKAFLDFMSTEYPDVSISISVYDYPKDKYYDFAANPHADDNYVKSMRLNPLMKEVEEAFNIIKEGANSGKYNIHMGKANGFIDLIKDTCDSSYHCNIVYEEDPISFPTLTIDADGEFRLCLRISGNVGFYTKDIFRDNIENTKEALRFLATALRREYLRCCKGCAWSCPMMDTFWDDKVDVSHGQSK